MLPNRGGDGFGCAKRSGSGSLSGSKHQTKGRPHHGSRRKPIIPKPIFMGSGCRDSGMTALWQIGSEVRTVPVLRRDPGDERPPPRRACRRGRVASQTARARNEAQRADRRPEPRRTPPRGAPPGAPHEANLPTEVIGLERIALYQAKPIAAHDAGRAEGSQPCPRRSWRHLKRLRPARRQVRRAKPICRPNLLALRGLHRAERSQSRRMKFAVRTAASRAQDGRGAASGGHAAGSL